MSLWTCLDCLTRYAVGLSRCPHCNSESYSEDELPKTTVSNGGSNARAELEPDYVAPEGDEQPSAGTSSSASDGKSGPNSTTGQDSHPSPAPTTESPSPKRQRRSRGPDASSTAGTTDGSIPGTGADQKAPDVTITGGVVIPRPGAGNG